MKKNFFENLIFFRMTNHKIILQTFERSAALQRVERLRLYMSGAETRNNI